MKHRFTPIFSILFRSRYLCKSVFHPWPENTDLVQALRQCDGGRVQYIVMVRDDFWLAATRFMGDLEVELLQGQNTAPADLFDLAHARKVLAAFGRAFGRLPDQISETKKQQEDFLKQSVEGLAEEGKVICVRLALFAEMMKGKEWTTASLKEVGGTKGVGVTFLEETFSAQTAHPKHRLHQKAARAVLKDLLPDSGTDIKGYMRSHAELLEASGYASRPKDFDDLIRILDREIRLITPTDPEGKDTDEDFVTHTQAGQKYFQLTHDYLVHSLRDWLTRRQKETRKGRAELKLFDTSLTWNAKPENRFLPSWWEHLTIRVLTDRKKWTEPQRKMMSKAGRVHGIRTSLIALLLIAASVSGLSIHNSVIESQNLTRAEALVDTLASADIAQTPKVISELNEYREWADPLLKTKLAAASDGSPEQLQLSLALLPVDEGQIECLRDQLPVCSLSQFPVLREALLPYKNNINDPLWQVATDEHQDGATRFQAASALAQYAPDDERWQATIPFVAQHLTSAVSSVDIRQWRELLQPASEQLAGPLTAIHADRTRSVRQRETAAFMLSEYLKEQPDKLVDAMLVADELAEFSLLSATLKAHTAAVYRRLLDEMQAPMPTELDKTNDRLSDEGERSRDAHWKRQSLAAVTLVQWGFGDDVSPLLKFTPHPSLRSFIIYHLGKLGTDHNTLAARFELEDEVSIGRALIQSLGGSDAALIPPTDRSRIVERLQTLYVNDPDPGIHSSASWTLRQWGVTLPELPVGEPTLTEAQRQKLAALTAEVEDIRHRIIDAEDKPLQRLESRLAAAETALRDAHWDGVRRWYVNSQAQTMVVIPNLADFGDGQLNHRFSICSHEVTATEFRRFRADYKLAKGVAPTDDCPANSVSWYDAAAYCNWLSEKDGLHKDQWAYEPNNDGQYGDGMKIKENALELTGYRLPTEAEWQYACRAGSSGTYAFGEPTLLLDRYARYISSSSGLSQSVESLLPNADGLFDMHGNVWEWVQNTTTASMSPVKKGNTRLLHGGSFSSNKASLGSAVLVDNRPTIRADNYGFRPSRNLHLSP